MEKRTPLQAWSERTGVPYDDAKTLRRLMSRRHREGTAECNGDPHPSVADRSDKNANAAAWGENVSRTIAAIDEVCSRHGLTFDAGTGLWGSVMRDGKYIDDVPDSN